MHVGQRIKERRKDLGMSVDELAKQLGKNRATIYRYEKGDIENLPVDILEPLSIALHTTPQHLMGWDSNNDNDNNTEFEKWRINEHVIKWNTSFAPGTFTDEEFEKLVEYARFLIMQRNNKGDK